MIDTHCHLTFEGLHEQVDAVLERAHEAGVDRMISVGTGLEQSRQAIAVAQHHAGVFATVGIHPHEAAANMDQSAVQAELAALLREPRVVALGEIGLDYHYPDPPRDLQHQLFAWQLEIVQSTNPRPEGVGFQGSNPKTQDSGLKTPIIIHNREATDDVLAMIRDSGLPGERFVFHCFTGSAAELEKILAIGAMVSFTGIVTFGSARDVATASDAVPLERMMIETDSPYLTPEPFRKHRPNEPRFVAEVAKFLAQRRGMTVEQFTAAMDANAERFFGLDS